MIISALVNSHDKRFEKDNFIISFYENEKFITTNQNLSCYNYLGETSTNIFLFDIETKESIICNKQSISDIKIKNSTAIDDCTAYIKSTLIYKQFQEIIHH